MDAIADVGVDRDLPANTANADELRTELAEHCALPNADPFVKYVLAELLIGQGEHTADVRRTLADVITALPCWWPAWTLLYKAVVYSGSLAEANNILVCVDNSRLSQFCRTRSICHATTGCTACSTASA